MLRKETVTPATLELLNRLMQDKHLADFTLVGGTALALQIAHRHSIDIDLFTRHNFDETDLRNYLSSAYGFILDFSVKNTLKGEINRVKVDLIAHDYPDVKPPLNIEDVRMATPEDIAAMKLNAIIGNGSRIKDFVDIAYLSALMPLRQMIEAYASKYSDNNPAMALKALNFHEDINFDEPVHLLNGGFNWNDIVKRLANITREPDLTFEPMITIGKQRIAPSGCKGRGL
jgi:hypothetical protein